LVAAKTGAMFKKDAITHRATRRDTILFVGFNIFILLF
jgi:hypothetical protein